jgi:hypothetical protein
MVQAPVILMYCNWGGDLHRLGATGRVYWQAIVIKDVVRAYAVVCHRDGDFWFLEGSTDKRLPWYDYERLNKLIDEGGNGKLYRTKGEKDAVKRPNQSPEPTVMLVTPRACARVAPSTTVAHL